jgi:hypothetical protein
VDQAPKRVSTAILYEASFIWFIKMEVLTSSTGYNGKTLPSTSGIMNIERIQRTASVRRVRVFTKRGREVGRYAQEGSGGPDFEDEPLGCIDVEGMSHV